MTTIHDLVFLFDVDNTLLDNDRVQADMAAYLTEAFGDDACKLYWTIFEQLRGEFGYAETALGALLVGFAMTVTRIFIELVKKETEIGAHLSIGKSGAIVRDSDRKSVV